jgi:quinol monooxygenase YgiN
LTTSNKGERAMSRTTASQGPVRRLVIYRPKPGHLDALQAIVTRHGPVLRQLGLVTEDPVRVCRATDIRAPDSGAFLLEEFVWRDDAASEVAHQTPEVMAVWETMGPHLADMTLITLDPIG